MTVYSLKAIVKSKKGTALTVPCNLFVVFRFQQAITSAVALVNNGDAVGFFISIDEEGMTEHFHPHDRFFQIHALCFDRLGSNCDIALVQFNIVLFDKAQRQFFTMPAGQAGFLTANLIFQLIDR